MGSEKPNLSFVWVIALTTVYALTCYIVIYGTVYPTVWTER